MWSSTPTGCVFRCRGGHRPSAERSPKYNAPMQIRTRLGCEFASALCYRWPLLRTSDARPYTRIRTDCKGASRRVDEVIDPYGVGATTGRGCCGGRYGVLFWENFFRICGKIALHLQLAVVNYTGWQNAGGTIRPGAQLSAHTGRMLSLRVRLQKGGYYHDPERKEDSGHP